MKIIIIMMGGILGAIIGGIYAQHRRQKKIAALIQELVKNAKRIRKAVEEIQEAAKEVT